MQFGVFSVGDVTPDPATGRVPTEAERIQAMIAIALIATDDPVTIAEDYVFAALRPAGVPEEPPTHASLVASEHGVAA